MQDKPTTDYQKLADKGWAGMQTMLDREMPLRSRRKPLIWTFLLTAAAGVAGFVIMQQRSAATAELRAGRQEQVPYAAKENSQSITHQAGQAAADLSEAAKENSQALAAITPTQSNASQGWQDVRGGKASLRNDVNASSSSSVLLAAPAKQAVNTGNDSQAFAGNNPALSDANQQGAQIDTPDENTLTNQAQTPVALTAQGATAASAATSGSPYTDQKDQEPAAAAWSTGANTQDIQRAGEIALLPGAALLAVQNSGTALPANRIAHEATGLRSRKWTIWAGGIYNFPSLSTGVTGGIQYRIARLGSRWSIHQGVSGEYLDLGQVFITDEVNGKTQVTNSTEGLQDVAELGGSNGTISRSTLSDALALRLHTQAEFACTPRLSVVGALSPGYIISRTYASRDKFFSTPNTAYESNQAAALTRSWDILGSLGLQFRLNKTLGISAAYRYGITPYISGLSKMQAADRANQLSLGLQCRF